MFEGFARVWTPLAASEALKKAPLAFTLAGEKIVLFRDLSGAPAALLDRCPHRGVALSLGQVMPASGSTGVERSGPLAFASASIPCPCGEQARPARRIGPSHLKRRR